MLHRHISLSPLLKSTATKKNADSYEEWAFNTRKAVLERESKFQESPAEDRKYEAMLRTTEHTVQKVADVKQRIESLRSEFLLEFVNLKKNLLQSEQIRIIIIKYVLPLLQHMHMQQHQLT